MKFLGMTMNQFYSSDRNQSNFFADPYEALQHADRCWRIENGDSKNPRLLIVLKTDENGKESEYAFFEFSNSEECRMFVSEKRSFSYSEETGKIWNGNPKLMAKR